MNVAEIVITVVKMETTFIYTLRDPRTHNIVYVGKADNLEKRLNVHLKEKGHYPKVYWIKKLIRNGLIPSIDVLDVVLKSEWQFWERYWIQQLKSWGIRLLNKTNGGEGGDTGITKEGRIRLSISKIGNKGRIGQPHKGYTITKMKDANAKYRNIAILNTETGIFYTSARDAYNAGTFQLSERYLRGMLSGKFKNNTNFIKLPNE